LFTGVDLAAPDLCCGSCGEPIIRRMVGTFVNFVCQCRACGAFNDVNDIAAPPARRTA
jgi:hypothetical protein